MYQIRHKFRAQKTEVNERSFPSKLEAAYYKQLLARQARGEILFFLMQVPLHLPGKVKYVCDFVEFHADDKVIFTECKGVETPLFKMKLKQVEEIYPFKINIVKKVKLAS